MILEPLSDSTEEERASIAKRVEECRERGECPTCANLKDGSIYPPAGHRTFLEESGILCMLEQYPRNPGHTIILPQQHWEDVSELPTSEFQTVYGIIHRCITALKSVLGAEKVYLCTMCDGGRNHLHYQLIPRLPGEIHGSRVFVKERKVLRDPADVVEQLRDAVQDKY